MKLSAAVLLLALLVCACATHHPKQTAAKPLRRAPGETAEEFADRKAEVREHDREIKEERKGFSDPQATEGF